MTANPSRTAWNPAAGHRPFQLTAAQAGLTASNGWGAGAETNVPPLPGHDPGMVPTVESLAAGRVLQQRRTRGAYKGKWLGVMGAALAVVTGMAWAMILLLWMGGGL